MIRVLAGLSVGVAGALGILWWWTSRPAPQGATAPIPGEGEHLVIEVLNGTRIDGLARAVTRRLQRSGIDVVFFGTADTSDLDSTRILIRRGDSTAAVRVRQLLGVGHVSRDPDERLLLDASVILGRDAARVLRLDP